MSRYTAFRLACVGGTLLVAMGCGRVIEPGDDEVIESGLCDPSEEWHVVDNQIDERGVQSLLWLGDGPIVATQFSSPGDNLSDLERYDRGGDALFRKGIDSRVRLLAPTKQGFLAVGHRDGKPRSVSIESHEGTADFTWRVTFQTDEDVWPAAVYELDDALLVIGTQETYSGADTDVVVYGLSPRGEPRFDQVYGEDPPTLGESSDERVVGSYAFENHAVLVTQTWLNGSGGPLKAFALNAAGETLWEYTDSFKYARGTHWAVAPTSDGGALITGSPSTGGVSTGSARLLRLSAEGQALWVETLTDPEVEDPEVMAAVQLPGGDFFLTGYGWGPTAHSWRIDSDGQVLGVTRHGAEQLGGAPGFSRVLAMPAGGVLLAAESHDSNGSALSLLRTDSAGEALWQHRVEGAGIGFLSDLIVSPQGQVVLAGRFAVQDSEDERHVFQLSDACQLESATR